jgi:diacylglycerol kinase (ATP)
VTRQAAAITTHRPHPAGVSVMPNTLTSHPRSMIVPPVVSTAAIPHDADRVAILVNPKSGRTDAQPRADRLADLLRTRGFQTELFTDLTVATAQASQWHAEGRLRVLVAVGGDGTAAELVNRTSEGLPLTLLPAGNSNLLAGYFHLGKDPETLCRTVGEGVVARVDAGAANGRIFLLMAGCGFDADVVHRVHAGRTGHVSNRSYFRPVAEAVWSYEFPEIRVHWDEDNRGQPQLSARWMFAFNLPCYGGGFQIAPRADGSDGLLDVVCLRSGRLWPGLGYVAAILLGQHHRLPGCTMRRARRLRITSGAPVPYQLDGDPGGWLPLEIETLPGRLALLVPREAVESG